MRSYGRLYIILQPIMGDTIAEMLSTSVRRVSIYDRFKADAVIESNFPEFYNKFLTYDSYVDELYTLDFVTRFQKYFSGMVDREEKDGSKEKSRIQYYLERASCYKWCKHL